MSKVYFYATFLTLYLLFQSCTTTQKINTFKPEPDDAAPLLYENTISTIAIPLLIKLRDIEYQTNKILSGIIYEDNNIEDDNYTITVWKQSNISLKNINGKIETILPLKAIVKYRVGTSKMGLNLYKIQEINLDGSVTLNSDVNLYNWRLNTKTDITSLDWNNSPSMVVLGKNVPITFLIAPTIKLFKSKIEKNIDDAIIKVIDFKPHVLDVLEKICVPSKINETYNTWVRINPIALNSTAAKLKEQSIEIQMELKCNIETLLGSQPISKFERNKILLTPVKIISNAIEANIIVVSTYADASSIMNDNFKNKTFGEGSRKVMVENVSIWQKNGKMVIALDLIGSINGKIYLVGLPYYNTVTKEISFDQLDYALDTKNKLIRTASWLASGVILKKLQQNCRYSIKTNLEVGKQSMLQYLTNYSPMTGIYINGAINTIDFQRIQLTNKAIIAFLKINGNIKVAIDGIQ